MNIFVKSYQYPIIIYWEDNVTNSWFILCKFANI